MSKEPEGSLRPEEATPRPYTLAAPYPDEASSAPPYQEAQELIYQHDERALSVFRLQLRRFDPLPDGWFVSVVGDEPPVEYQQHFRRILSGGEEVELPEELIAALRRRREELSKMGNGVKGHYPPARRRRPTDRRIKI